MTVHAHPPEAHEEIAVISDVHGNLRALEAVLNDIEARGVTRIWCLGDTTDYGPDSAACLSLVLERCEIVLAGNHDLAVAERIRLDDFTDESQATIKTSRMQIADTPHLMAALATMQPQQCVAPFTLLTHASPLDPVWHYVSTTYSAGAAFDATPADIALVLCGHTHLPQGYHRQHHRKASKVGEHQLQHGDMVLRPDTTAIVTVGSVGLPRSISVKQRDPQAQWAIAAFNEQGTPRQVQWQRTMYDMHAQAAHMERCGVSPYLCKQVRLGG